MKNELDHYMIKAFDFICHLDDLQKSKSHLSLVRPLFVSVSLSFSVLKFRLRAASPNPSNSILPSPLLLAHPLVTFLPIRSQVMV